MVKAFKESEKRKSDITLAAIVVNSDEQCDDEDDTNNNEENDDDHDHDDAVADVFESTADILDNSPVMAVAGILLPQHMRCSTHTLNLVATKDAEGALSDAMYKRVYRQAVAKATAIWNACSRSAKAADAAFGIVVVGHRFIVPCVLTRWNSYYHAVKSLMIAEDKLKDMCIALSLPPLASQDILFLKEYLSLMEPLAVTLDVLQGDKYACLGYLLPTLSQLKSKLAAIHLTVVKPLYIALSQGIDKRFGSELTDTAVTHPKFKVDWIKDPDMKRRCTMLLANAITADGASPSSVSNSGIQLQVTTAAAATMSTSSTSTAGSAGTINADNCFDDIVDTALTSGDLCTKYLNDTSKDLTMLNRHSQFKHLFKKFNTVLPSSAPVERLFSQAACILTKRRSRLSDDMFQKLLLLKINHSFWSE